jgi:class 3 adenylate cyclase
LALLGKEHIVDLRLGDHAEIECTVLFSDMRDFSKITESLVPEDTFRFVNMYLGQMGPVVREHHGFIDKYIGDAIMALFLNPDDAIRAAMAMLDVLPEYNAARAELGRVPIRMGIGVHSGPVMVGTIGEPDRMEGTVLSDVVNTASRLEGLTKEYQEPLLISDSVAKKLSNSFTTELIDEVHVKGKQHKVTVMKVTVVGD